MFEYFINIIFEMFLSGWFLWELLDNYNLFGGVKIFYENLGDFIFNLRLNSFV